MTADTPSASGWDAEYEADEVELAAEQKTRRWRRRLVVAVAAAVVLGAVVAVTADVVFAYVPAVRAVLRARTDLEQAEALLRNDPAHLDAARVAQAQALLQDAGTELGAPSAAIDGGVLAGFGSHLPWIGRQIDAARALRRTALEADAVGLDLVPIVEEMLPGAGAPGATTLTRLAATAHDQQAVIARLPGDVAGLGTAAASIPGGSLLGPLDAARSVVQRDVPPIVDSLGAAIPFLDAVPTAAGPGRHVYLVLVANPGEERPGGGFIGAIGEVDITDGAITSHVFRDSVFSDALVHDIPAPRPLNDYVFQGHPWTLSDANWSPDFPTSAAQVATFYRRATGVRADGEIEVDPVAFSSLLSVLGPVQVAPYPQVITAQNALVEINDITNRARPGDPGKVFLPPFGDKVLDLLTHAPIAQLPELVDGLRTAVGEKHLVLHFEDASLQAIVDAHGAGGEMEAPLSDAVFVVDANVGLGKGDLYTTRRYDLTATVDALGEVRDHLALTYTSPVLTDPAARVLVQGSAGAYRDYLRVYLPEPAHLDRLTLTAKGTTSVVTPEATTYDLNRFVVAFFLDVPPGQTVTLGIDYDGGFADITSGPIGWTLGWEKQVSALPWPVSVTVHLPEGVTRTWSAKLDGDLRFSTAAG